MRWSVEDSKMSQTAIVMSDDDDDLTCNYLPESNSFSYGGEFDTISTKDICIRYIDKINESLRDFEDYFDDDGIELGK